MAYHAEVQHRVAEMGLAIEPIEPHLERIAEDWSNGVNHGAAWPAKIFSAKYHAVESSWRIVDLALEVAGGFGIFRRSGLEQIFRDARLGRIHPANSMLTHEIVGEDAARDQPGRNAALGLGKHRGTDLHRYFRDAIRRQAGAARVFAYGFRIRRVVFAIDLAFGGGDITANPAHALHLFQHRHRTARGRHRVVRA